MGYPDFLKVTVQFVMLGGYFRYIYGEIPSIFVRFKHNMVMHAVGMENIKGIRIWTVKSSAER